MGIVEELRYYPVKGLRGVSVERTEVGETGLPHDREFMVVHAEDGTFVSQRVTPSMARISVALSPDRLILSAPGSDDAEVSVITDGPRREVSLFRKWFGAGVDQGDPIAKWLSGVLDRDVRLVRVPPDHDRPGWGSHGYEGKVGFADAHAVSVNSLASLADLNDRIQEHGGDPIPVDRFRPNIVVSGWEPYVEDRALRWSAGTAELGFCTVAIRCAVPTVDQETGEKHGAEPTRTLATYRREPDLGGGVSFGAKMAVLTPGVIAVGDEITVHEWIGAPATA